MKHNAIAFALFSTVPVLASAQSTDIEHVTVTGDFRQSTLNQLSSSASIIDANRLQSRQANHLESMLNVAPNVNFSTGASRGRFIQIRGIGERSQYAEPLNPSVSFLVDDFDFSGLAAAGVLFDTKQVEVYRGPQATIFGTGALAGAVKIVSRQPEEDGEGHLELMAGNKSSYRIEAGHGDRLSRDVTYRAAFVHNQSDGFMVNDYLNRDDTQNIDETAVRLGVNWSASDDVTLALNYRWYDVDNGYDAFSLDNDRHTLSDEPGFDRQRTHALSAHLTNQMSIGELAIILTHASHDIEYGYDEDWTYPGFHPSGYTSFDAYFRDISQTSAEVRLTSSTQSRIFGDSTDWVLGARVNGSEQDVLREYTYNDGDFINRYEPVTKAVYGQTDTSLSDKLTLTLALRVENYDYDYSDNAGVSFSQDTTMTGGKVALSYAKNSRVWYASISRGFKGAGVNYDEQVSEQSRFYDAEYNWNYELGVKGQFWDPSLSIRAAVFYMDRENTQISDYDVQTREDGSASFIDIIANADVGTNQGAEIELNWQATDSWLLSGSVGYLDATFQGYTTADGNEVAKQRQAQAPRFTANVYSQWWIAENWTWRVDMDFKDEYRFSDGHDETSPPTALFNTELSWLYGNWQTTAWVKNVFDRTYYTRGFGGFSNDPRDEYAFPEPYYQLGNGRQFGITARYQF